MKAIKYWAKAIAMDSVPAVLLYLWLGVGLEGAGNVFAFWGWVTALLGFVYGVHDDKTSFAADPRPRYFGVYKFVSVWLILAAMAWAGMVWLPAFYLWAVLLMESARRREPKATRLAQRAINAERSRQKDVEGWTPEHDDQHDRGDLAAAAASYATATGPGAECPDIWPWDVMWWKPGDYARNLEKAGALIQAELEREYRAKEKKGGA